MPLSTSTRGPGQSLWRLVVPIVLVLGGITAVTWFGLQAVFIVDQANNASQDVTLQLRPGEYLEQTFTPEQNVVSRVLLKANNLEPVTLSVSISQAGREHTSEVVTVKPGLLAREPLVFGRGFDEALPEGIWLSLPVDTAALQPGQEATLRITLAGEKSLFLALEKNELTYPKGSLMIEGRLQRGNLGFMTARAATWPEAAHWHLVEQQQTLWLVSIVLILLTLGWAWYAVSKRTLAVEGLIILMAIAGSLPLYGNMTHWGVWDWPEAASAYAAATHSVSAGQFPSWNPYVCGGLPAWTDPQPYWPSLTWLLTLPFGLLLGTKVAITVYLIIGSLGMYRLARLLGTSATGGLLAGLVYSWSGFVTAHLAAGQLLWLTMAWAPWVLVFVLLSKRSRWWIVLAAITYLLILFEGRVYLSVYVALLLPIIALGYAYKHRATKTMLASLVLFAALVLSLGAVKILPTTTFLSDVSSSLDEEAGIPFNRLWHVFTTRNVSLHDYQPPWLSTMWHEWSAYVGVIPLALAVVGFVVGLRKRDPLHFSLGLAGIIFLSIATAPSAQYNILEYIPVVDHLHNPTRAIGIVVFVLALASGWGIDALQHSMKRIPARSWVVTLIVLLVGVDLIMVARTPWSEIFSEVEREFVSSEPFRQVGGHHNNALHYVVAGYGAKEYCPPHARLWKTDVHLWDERTFLKSDPPGAPVTMTRFTPNRIELHADTVSHETLVQLNQKHDQGWQSSEVTVFSHEGRIAFRLPPAADPSSITLAYRAPLHRLGAGITATTFGVLVLVWWYTRHRTQRDKLAP